MFMWLERLSKVLSQSKANRRLVRPTLTLLEDRCLLTTYTVNTVLDLPNPLIDLLYNGLVQQHSE
jgi:hypothetical protein